MKKTAVILVAVVALVAAVHFIDTKLANTPKASAAPPSPMAEVKPDVSFKDLDGKDVNIADLRGKVLLVDFWETTCEPCKIEIPWLIELQQKYQSKGLTILGVAMDTDGKSVVVPWVAKQRFDVNGTKLPIDYPILIGNDKGAQELAPDLVGYPTSVLISRDGKIVKTTLGLVSFDEIENDIKKQLGI